MRTTRLPSWPILLFVIACTISCKKHPVAECIGRPTKGMCTFVYEPVCGCNNKTYGNACEAKRAGVRTWVNGACKKS